MRAFYSLRALGFLIALVIVVLALASQLGAFDSGGNNDRFSDGDKDRFSDSVEGSAGTDPLDDCADNFIDNAWPPDFDNDNVITDSDLSRVSDVVGQGGSIAPARSDLNSDNAITGADLSTVAGRIGNSCEP